MRDNNNGKYRSAVVHLPVVAIAAMVLIVGTAAAQDPSLAPPQSALGNAALPLWIFGGGVSLAPTASVGTRPWQASHAPVVELVAEAASTQGNAVRPAGPQRITLE